MLIEFCYQIEAIAPDVKFFTLAGHPLPEDYLANGGTICNFEYTPKKKDICTFINGKIRGTRSASPKTFCSVRWTGGGTGATRATCAKSWIVGSASWKGSGGQIETTKKTYI